jgi:hypothetical protein
MAYGTGWILGRTDGTAPAVGLELVAAGAGFAVGHRGVDGLARARPEDRRRQAELITAVCVIDVLPVRLSKSPREACKALTRPRRALEGFPKTDAAVGAACRLRRRRRRRRRWDYRAGDGGDGGESEEDAGHG